MLAGIAAISLTATSMSAQNRIELEPYSDWVLNYDDDSCALQRQFGEEGRQVYLELRQFGPNTDLQVIVASPDFGQRRGNYEVTFEPIDQEANEFERFNLAFGEGYEGKLFPYSLGSGPEWDAAFRDFVETTPVLNAEQKDLVSQSIGLEPDSNELQRLTANGDYQVAQRLARPAFRQRENYRNVRDRRETAVRGIFLDSAFDEPILLRTGSLHAPMEAMRSCIDELLTHWGIDAEAHQSLTREVLPADFERWSRRVRSQYPSQMVREGLEGYLRIRLNVSAQGEVTGCHVQLPISNEAFARTACDNLERAEFFPALDAQGEPIDSYYQIAIVYRLHD